MTYKGGLLDSEHSLVKTALLEKIMFQVHRRPNEPDIRGIEEQSFFESLKTADFALEKMFLSETNSIEYMFDAETPASFIISALDHMILCLKSDLLERLGNHWREFLSWIFLTKPGSRNVVIPALNASDYLLRRFLNEQSFELVILIIPLFSSEDEMIQVRSLESLTSYFQISLDARLLICEQWTAIIQTICCLKRDSVKLASSALIFLRNFIFFLQNEPKSEQFVLNDYIRKIIEYGLRWLSTVKSCTKDALKLFHTLCLSESMFDIAIQMGLEDRLLKLLVMIPDSLICGVYRVLFQVIDICTRFDVNSLITTDASFFKKSADFLRSRKRKHVKAVLYAIDPLIVKHTRAFWDYGVIQACLDVIGSVGYENARHICLLIGCVIERAPRSVMRAVGRRDSLKVMCEMFDSEEIELVKTICFVLVVVWRCEFEGIDEVFEEVRLRETLVAMAESDVKEIAEACVCTLEEIYGTEMAVE
jgi:hypothetical protein